MRLITVTTCDRCGEINKREGDKTDKLPPAWSEVVLLRQGFPDIRKILCVSCDSQVARSILKRELKEATDASP